MSLWSRIANVFRGDRLSREIDEELQSHIDEADRAGPRSRRSPPGVRLRAAAVAKRAAISGSSPWLDSLRADAVFGWRQLLKKKVTSAAAILSLALAIGACTSAFRLIDALLLRPLPVAERRAAVLRLPPGTRLRRQASQRCDSCEYPLFRRCARR